MSDGFALPEGLIYELSRELQQWMEHLPQELRSFDGKTSCAPTLEGSDQWFTLQKPSGEYYQMISPLIVLAASLQTRYKYAKYLIWRGYIHKALASPASMTQKDFTGVEQALEVAHSSTINELGLTSLGLFIFFLNTA